MAAVDFGHTSNPDKTGFGSNQRLLNAYPEAMGEAAKSPLPVYAVPGTSRFDTGATGLNGPCRGMLYVFGKGLYVIAGTAAALFDDQGNATPVSGTVGGSSMAIMAANQRPNPQIGIVADNVYYVLDTGTNTITATQYFDASRPEQRDVSRWLSGFLDPRRPHFPYEPERRADRQRACLCARPPAAPMAFAGSSPIAAR